MSSSVSNAPLTMQRHTRAQEGLALVWSPVPGAIRYGFVVGFADMPVPPIDAIMRGAAPGFTVLGIPPRFTGAVDLGSPVGEERQYALIAYRGDGAMAPVAGVQFLPARSAPRDREYHPLIPPALTRPPGWVAPVPAREATPTASADTAPARMAPADPWAALESAAGDTSGASSPSPVSPVASAGTVPTQPADPWAALDAAAREQQSPPSEPATPNISFASPQASVQPPVSPPNTPADRPVEPAPEQYAEPSRERQAEPARQDAAPTPVERPAASLQAQAPQAPHEQAPQVVPTSQAQAPTPAAPEQQEERKAGRWGVFQALRQKIVTPIVPPPAREDQPRGREDQSQAPAEAHTPDEAPPSIAPAASISSTPPSTTPATPPASEPVEAIPEVRQQERTEAIPEVKARTEAALPVEERPAPEEREAAPEQTVRPAAEAVTPAEERTDEQIILPEPVAFVEQAPTAAEEPSDAWIAQAEAELAAQWAARSAQEERPDVSADAATDVSAAVAPAVLEEATPAVLEEVALAAPAEALAQEEQAATAAPAEEEQAAASGSPAAPGSDQAPVLDVQATEPDAPSVPAAVVSEDTAPIVGEDIGPIVGEDIGPHGEAPTPIMPEAAPVHAKSVETLAAETAPPAIGDTADTAEMPAASDVPVEEEEVAPAAEYGATDLAVENPGDVDVTAGAAAAADAEAPRPVGEAVTPSEDHEHVESPHAAVPVEVEVTATPIPTEVEAHIPPVEADVRATPVEADVRATPVEADVRATPVEAETLAVPVEAEAPTAPVEAEAPTAPVEAEATGVPEVTESQAERAELASAIEPSVSEAQSERHIDIDEVTSEPVAGELEAPTLAEPPMPTFIEPSPPALAESLAPQQPLADASTAEAADTPVSTEATAGPVESVPEIAGPSTQEPVDLRVDEGINEAIEPVSELLAPEPAEVTETAEVGNAHESEQAAVAETMPGDTLIEWDEASIYAPQAGQGEEETVRPASALFEEPQAERTDEPREEWTDNTVAPVPEEPVAVETAAASTTLATPEAKEALEMPEAKEALEMPEAKEVLATPEAEPTSGSAIDEVVAPPVEAAAIEIVPAEPEPPAIGTIPAEPEPSAVMAASAGEPHPATDAEPTPPALAAEFVPTLSAASVESESVPELEVMLESVAEPDVVLEPIAEPDVELPEASVPEVAPEVVPETDPALAGPAPSPSEAVAMLDEAELYLLPTWLDLAAAARLLAQAARAIPGDPRLLDLQRQLHDAQATDDGEDVEDMLREARAALERRDYWGAVDSYEQALARQGDNAEARQGLERARVLARWSAQMSGAGSDAGRLQHIGDDFMEAAPDLAAQSYAAAFAAHPTIVILRGLLLSQAHSEQWDGLVESATHGVAALRQSGRIAADPAQDAAVTLLRQQLQASTALGGVQGAIENLTQTLVASAQQGQH